MTKRRDNWIRKEDIVISGISGAFPQSENIEEFKDNLFAGKLLIEDIHRWGPDVKNVPRKAGLIKTIDRFDHSFFRVNRKHVEEMEIGARMILEKTFEAIIDAGYNPGKLKNTRTGVFYGSYGDVEMKDNLKGVNEYSALGKSKALMANRISYWLDVHGPSVTMDTACSSSLVALDSAFKSIQNGDCDAAIVCSSNVGISPGLTYAFNILGILSPDGVSRPFDAEANGAVRGEAISVVFLQKVKDARRVYAHIVHSKTNCDGFKEEGIAFPSKETQLNLFKSLYDETDINPQSLKYIEAHGTATKVGDIIEVDAIDEFFCTGRSEPLKIGSLKSNMGHSEGCSGLSSLTKLIISFETGLIPPTLNLKTPHPKIDALHNGHIQVVTKNTPLEGEYFGLSSYGIGGSNAHILISPNKNTKKLADLNENNELPYLVTVSGRTEEAVNVILNDLEKNSTDTEYFRLMHEIFSENIIGHMQRGYIILKKENEPKKHLTFLNEEKRPIWFVFSGMGCQWPSMGKSLMRIPLFAESIYQSHKTLLNKGVDLIRIITENDSQIFNNIINSFVGIAAIQIALCNILKAIDIKPDGMIGHSLGELGCAYADGCFTAEQMILAAYYRGLVSLESEFIHGTMAAIGASYDTAKDLVPPEIDIACHNSPNSCTISGPTEIVKDFMKELQEKDIFVHEINTANIAAHSRYIASAAPKMMSYMKKIIPEPKLRSDKWICTSVPEQEWSTEKAKYSSAEYYTNNLLHPVLFEESSRHIPANAVVIEIAPHGLLQSILRKSLPTASNISLTMKEHEDGVEFLLNSLGQLYGLGCIPKLSNLYPPVKFPVSRSTPMISPLIKWQHDEEWPVDKFVRMKSMTGERDIAIEHQKDEDYEYLHGHVIDGRTLFPAMGYLGLVWETMALMQNTEYQRLSVIFESVRFQRATNVPKKGYTTFHVSIQAGTGQFEITENRAIVVSGVIRVPDDINSEKLDVIPFDDDEASDANILPLNKKDFYKELRLRGYHYKGLFKNVVYCNSKGTYGKTLWCNNFITYMDTIAQISLLSIDLRELVIPTFIRKIVIDVDKHFEILETLDKENPEFPVNHYPNLSLMCSGGIQMIDFKGISIPRKRDQAYPVLEKYQFVPYISKEQMDVNSAIRLCVHIMLENKPNLKIKTVELLNQPYNAEIPLISKSIANALGDLPLIQASVKVLLNSDAELPAESPRGVSISNEELPKDKSCSIIVLSDIQTKTDILEKVFGALTEGGFIITEESITKNTNFDALGLNVCFSRASDADKKILFLRKAPQSNSNYHVIRIENTSYSWLAEIQKIFSTIKNTEEKLVVYAEKEPMSGILGFFNCLRREEQGNKTKCFFLDDQNAPKFSLENPFYKDQYEKDLSHNVYKNGQWGSYRHVLLEPVDNIEVLHAYNTLLARGDLSSLRWVEGSLNPMTYSSKNPLIHVYYSALNFRDVMLTSGRISAMDTAICTRLLDCYHGIEYCGKDENGIRYMGIALYKGIASLVESEPKLMWKVPDHITLEEASTITIAYATVIYSLTVTMSLREGSSILIHAASGAVGQAAINICLYYKCNIFVTVGTPEKVEFIKKTYPQIPESNIGNSRDTSFEKLIMIQTDGRGVDVVLNSLVEDKLRASVRCVAKHGYFIEIGKYDMARNNVLEMASFLKAIRFNSIQLDDLYTAPVQEQQRLHDNFQDMLDKGIVKPICRTVYGVDQVETAIRYMAAGKHIGKVVIKIRDEENDIYAKPVPIRMEAQPRVVCQERDSYVLVGGLGGFGLELAEWLIIRGVRNIVLSSRTGVKNGYQSYKIKSWKSYGVNVVICTEDVTTETGVENLLQTAIALGPLMGIFNVAVILKDGPFDTQTEENFAISAGPKAIATIHLDKLSRLLCPELQYFVVFSSVVCGRGNLDQTNYGMSNSIMERICEARHADNLPALAIQWGAIGEVGVVADLAEDNLNVVIGGTLQQKVNSCLQTLDQFMKQSNPIVASMIVAEKRHADTDVINAVAHILGIKDLKTISLTWTFPELGMDSIMAIEIKQVIEEEFDIFLTPKDLKSMTFAQLYKLKEEKEKELKSGGGKKKVTFLEEKFVTKPLLRIPFAEEDIIDEISAQDNPTVFIFPGFEGTAKAMVPLADNLNIQSLCFQYLIDAPEHTMESYRDEFLKHIYQRLGSQQDFHIIAHSGGTIMTLEITRVLENQGRKGYLWFIDGSPDYTITAADRSSVKNQNDEETMQCFVCMNLVQALAPDRSYEEFAEHLTKANTWEKKKKFCSSVLPRKMWSESTVHKILDKYYGLTKQAHKFTFGEPLETRCTLIRSVEDKFDLDECYGLSKYFKHPVQVHQVEANHTSILGNRQTADIIMDNQVWKNE